ncbi:MAG TPA: hypothetical protein VFL13_08810 [Candidatus Baltobacteraceae bacterium]|nr:hypothetical protein [Candidatus Baltobacteraceae bacterium]
MNNRYRAMVALTSLLLLAGAPVPRGRHTAVPSTSLYSQRALRRARTILQLKLLELRKARLERVFRAIERGLPPDEMKHIPPACV